MSVVIPTGPAVRYALSAATAERWFRDKKGHLNRKQVSYVLDDDAHRPVQSNPPTAEEAKLKREWKLDNSTACGLIWEDLTEEQKSKETVINAFEADDAKGLWAALKKLVNVSTVTSRYMAIVDLIRLTMGPSETLVAFLNRVRAATAKWHSLWPANFQLTPK